MGCIVLDCEVFDMQMLHSCLIIVVSRPLCVLIVDDCALSSAQFLALLQEVYEGDAEAPAGTALAERYNVRTTIVQ